MSRKFTVLGHPLKHTMSPPIHDLLFKLDNKDGDYTVSDINTEDFSNYIKVLKSMDGFSITIPYKLEIIPHLDKLDKSAEIFGAVNCVHNLNGTHIGYNTDEYGFIKGLEASGFELKDKKVLLVGCGGAGRMMAISSALRGCTLTIAVREGFLYEPQKVAEEIKALGIEKAITITTLDNISGEYDILLNSTPVGMYPHVENCPVSDEIIKNCSCIFDAIYNPTETLLIKKAKSYGLKTVGGMAMLVWQAVRQHEIWDNSQYNTDDIKNIISQMEDIVTKEF